MSYLGSLKETHGAPSHKARSRFDKISPQVRISEDMITRRWNIGSGGGHGIRNESERAERS